MEGTFNVAPNSVEMLAGPGWTRDLLIRLSKKDIHRLRTAVAWAEQQAQAEDDAHRAEVLEKTVTSVAPELSPVLVGLRAKVRHEYENHLAAWVGILIALITLLVTMSGPQGISGEQLEQILEETVRHVQSAPDPTVGEAPTGGVLSTRGPEEPPPATEIPTPKTR